MEMKNVVLTAAIALACSAFADTVTQSWFELTQAPAVSFDSEPDDPLSVACPGAPESSSVAVYRIIATINDLKVFAAAPGAPENVTVDKTSKPAKASICAIDGKWYYYGSEWTELKKEGSDDAFTAPQDGESYTITVERDGSYVRYKVQKSGASEETSGWIASSSFVPSAFAFAGTGAYSSVVCEYEVTIPDNNEAVTVKSAENVDIGTIIIDPSKLAADEANDDGANGLKNWVNYVLNITNPTVNDKPYAAPVQNSDKDNLEFTIGGVGNVLGETTTGAKVTYSVEEMDDPLGTNATEKGSAVPTGTEYGTIKVAVPSQVKYYRIKIKIDPAH